MADCSFHLFNGSIELNKIYFYILFVFINYILFIPAFESIEGEK